LVKTVSGAVDVDSTEKARYCARVKNITVTIDDET